MNRSSPYNKILLNLICHFYGITRIRMNIKKDKQRYKTWYRELRKFGNQYNIHKIGVALSGGADSITLAHALLKAGFDIIALHCNFNLRGDESWRDQKFTERFCTEHNIPLIIKIIDTQQYIREHSGKSLEMACRETRYGWFKEMMLEKGLDRIAVGHNADDNIETFFINLLRGCGTSGLKGMVEDNGTIWRPLLKSHRNRILEYIKENGLNYIIDSSNLENDFRRNFLRNEIIPRLKKEWKGFDKAFDMTLRNINSENKIIEKAVSSALPTSTSPLSVETILQFPDPQLLIRRFISDLSPFTTTPDEILMAIKANKPKIKRWTLKKGSIRLQNGRLFKENDGGCDFNH